MGIYYYFIPLTVMFLYSSCLFKSYSSFKDHLNVTLCLPQSMCISWYWVQFHITKEQNDGSNNIES